MMELQPTLVLALAAIIAGLRPVRIPSLRVDLVPIHPFVLLALALQGGASAVLVGLAGIAASALGRTPRPAVKRLVFNLISNAVSTAAAAWTASRLGGVPGAPAAEWAWPLAAAAAAYFVTGTGLVAAAISIERREGYFATWNRSLRWTVIPYAAGLTIAVAALAVCQISLGAGVAMTVAPCWCLVLAYRAEAQRRLVSR